MKPQLLLFMKHYVISLCMICVAIVSSAQEHLSFKGIPIDGSIASFCQKLKAKGFVQLESKDNIRLFKGKFTGRNATIGVVAADNRKDVFSVTVFFEESDRWNNLVSTYEHYKDLYIEKYGQPIQCVEDNPSRSDSNISLMLDLSDGRVTYASLFEAPGGMIQLSIEKGVLTYGYVMIKYQDNQNNDAKRQSDLDEI